MHSHGKGLWATSAVSSAILKQLRATLYVHHRQLRDCFHGSNFCSHVRLLEVAELPGSLLPPTTSGYFFSNDVGLHRSDMQPVARGWTVICARNRGRVQANYTSQTTENSCLKYSDQRERLPASDLLLGTMGCSTMVVSTIREIPQG